MARSFLAGSISGGILGLGIATVASVLAPPVQPPEVTQDTPGTAAAPTEAATGHDASTERDASPQGTGGAGPAAAPDPDDLAALAEDTQRPGSVPQTGNAGQLADPSAPAQDAEVALQGDAPVLPNPLALAPMSPQPADDLSISTEPAQPPVPQDDAPQSAFDQDAQAAEQTAEEVTAGTDTTDPETPAQQPGAEAEAEPAAETETVTEADTGPVDAQTETPQPDADSTPPPAETAETAPRSELPSVSQPAEEAPQAAEEKTEDTTQVAALAPSPGPQIGTPGVTLTDRASNVAIRRPGAATEDAATPAAAPADTGTEADASQPPVIRFAQTLDNPEAKPLLSIVLIDDGSSPTSGEAGLAALDSFPAAISFAVDAGLPDAADRMALYRASGFEVLAMVDLPEGAEAPDAETTLNAVLSQLPEVVGVLEGTRTGLQANREAADQVSAILASTGHGLLTQNRGLNTMPKLARKEGVPAAPIFRDFDSKGQTATVIRRFLDQAAFKAGQEGAVIMLGRMRPETITALLLWGLQDRAGQVAIAPVSAVLTREDG